MAYADRLSPRGQDSFSFRTTFYIVHISEQEQNIGSKESMSEPIVYEMDLSGTLEEHIDSLFALFNLNRNPADKPEDFLLQLKDTSTYIYPQLKLVDQLGDVPNLSTLLFKKNPGIYVPDLVQTLEAETPDPLKLKVTMFQLQKLMPEFPFVKAFWKTKGFVRMLDLVKDLDGTTLAYAFKALSCLVIHDKGKKMSKIVSFTYSQVTPRVASAVSANALILLTELAKHHCSWNKINEAAKASAAHEAAEAAKETTSPNLNHELPAVPYRFLVQMVRKPVFDTQMAVLDFFHALVNNAPTSAKRNEVVQYWDELEIDRSLQGANVRKELEERLTSLMQTPGIQLKHTLEILFAKQPDFTELQKTVHNLRYLLRADNLSIEKLIQKKGVEKLIEFTKTQGNLQVSALNALNCIAESPKGRKKLKDKMDKIMPFINASIKAPPCREAMGLCKTMCLNGEWSAVSKATAKYFKPNPYSGIVSVLNSGDFDSKVNALELIAALVKQAPEKEKQSTITTLKGADIMQAIDAQASIPNEDFKSHVQQVKALLT